MVIGQKGLRKQAKKRESEALQKNKINSELIPTFVETLCNVYATSRPKESDYYNRNDLIRIFNVIAKEIFGQCDDCPVVEGFGSFSMDLFSNKSDLDLSVNFADNPGDLPREEKIQVLRKFAKKLYTLQSRGHVSGVQPIYFAKVPVLKVADRGTGIECDISIENRDGVFKSKIVRLICSIDERFQMLSFLTKAWAKAQGINSSKDRTLNSISIVSLVAFHLQTRHPAILPPFSALLKDGPDPLQVQKLVTRFTNYGKKNQESLAELFVTLLVKLASVETLWPKGLCASPFEGNWILKAWEHKYGVMSVEDFTDRSENVARAVGIGEVKKIYQCIHFSLHHIRSFMNGKIQATNLRDILFGGEDLVGSAGKQTLSTEKRTLQPCSDFESTLKKMRPDGSLDGTGLPPIPFTAVLKHIAATKATATEIVRGRAPKKVRLRRHSHATRAGTEQPEVVWRGSTKGWPIDPPTLEVGEQQSQVVWKGAPTKGWPRRNSPTTEGGTKQSEVVSSGAPRKGWPRDPPTAGLGEQLSQVPWKGTPTEGWPSRNVRQQNSEVVWGESPTKSCLSDNTNVTRAWRGSPTEGWPSSHWGKKTTV